MRARSEIIRIGVASLGVGLLVGGGVGVLTSGTGSTQTSATTTTSTTTTTTTTTPDPSTTVPTVPPPVVLEFFASPTVAVCARDEQRTRVVLVWSSQDAESVSIEADGTPVVVDAGPTGRRAVALDCPTSGGTESHQLQLTATGADGETATKSTTVTVMGPASGPGAGRGGRQLAPDHQG